MQQNERIDSMLLAFKAMMGGNQAKIWTALPCIVESFDAAKMTASVQAAIQSNQQDIKTGKTTSVNLPLFTDVPVQFLSGGDFMFTMPIKKGDEGIGIFSSRCIDAWWQSGGVQKQAEFRMHDLSDCMFIPGIFSQPRVFSDINTSQPELRNKSGSVKFTMFDTGFDVKGDIRATGSVIAGYGTADQITLQTHKHPGNNLPPTPGT